LKPDPDPQLHLLLGGKKLKYYLPVLKFYYFFTHSGFPYYASSYFLAGQEVSCLFLMFVFECTGVGKKPVITPTGAPGVHDVAYLPPLIGEPYSVNICFVALALWAIVFCPLISRDP
jgi:hypothetical protein